MASSTTGLLVLGNQLFPASAVPDNEQLHVFMAEDMELCTYVGHHQQKLVLFLAAMREYADLLRSRNFNVTYHTLESAKDQSYEDKLLSFVANNDIAELKHFEIEDHFFADRISEFCKKQKLKQTVMRSPMFVTSRSEFASYLDDHERPFMADFYKLQRKKFGILMTADDQPRGGQWSFDEDNRKKLPAGISLPEMPESRHSDHTAAVIDLVRKQFSDHPGNAEDFWWPVTRRSALYWLRDFVENRLEKFGDFQDAISQRSETAFHSVISPMLNLGLITPTDVISKTLKAAEERDIPLNSLEGFVRQTIGWREFVRGIYHTYDEKQASSNFFGHRRSLTDAWYDGSTGIPPLDDTIKTALRLGWTHHISRLMIVGNLMNLSEIEPSQVHDWFMETHVDSSDWVMGPNVYGMALFADGGVFATKPYICGSNYLLKMSDYGKGEWCDTVDGLYWRFVDKHRKFFASNPRLSMMPRTFDKIGAERKQLIFRAAESFLEKHTR